MDLNTNTNVSLVTQAISKVLGVTIQTVQCATTFVELGGDSLSAILVTAECQKRGLSVSAGTFLRTPTLDKAIANAVLSAQAQPISPVSPSPSLFSEALEERHDIDTSTVLEIRNRAPCLGISAKDVLDKVNAAKFTESQLLLLRGSLDDPNINVVTLRETYTEWDAEAVCKAWTKVILTEPIFTDLIQDMALKPQQFLQWRTSQTSTEADHKEAISDALNISGPISMITAIVSQISYKRVTVVWRIHHAFMDGFSARILAEKVVSLLRGEHVSPGPSFKEVTNLLRTFQNERRESTRYFWASKREQYPTAKNDLQLSPQTVTERRKASQGRIEIDFPEKQLTEATVSTGYTKTVYIAAAWALTLSKFLDVEEVSFGLVFSGRDLPIPGAFEAVGPLINILPLFVRIQDYEKSCANFLRRIHESILELNSVQHSEAEDGFDRHFSSIMATQFESNYHASPSDQQSTDMQSGVPLNIIIERQSHVQLLYSTAQYTKKDALNIRLVFQQSMNSLLQDNLRLVDSLPKDIEDVVRRWSNCDSLETLEDSKGDDLVTLFENVVARRPNDKAVAQGSTSMSYDAFDLAANIVAHNLKAIGRNQAVCVFADRSINWLIAIFGILKAGGVYAPLDPSAPVTVRQANFERSGASVLLVPDSISREVVLEYRQSDSFNCIAVDELLAEIQADGLTEYPRRRIARPDDLAYICFTSGSTGRPKAVQCTHKGLVAFQKDHEVRLAAGSGTVVAQIMSPVFDGSIHEIFSALTHGATLRLPSSHQEEPFSHLELCNSAILTPSIAKALSPKHYPRLQNVYLVGEAVPQSVCDAWAPGRQLYNMYGPTEATCGATIQRLLPDVPVTLGRVNPSSRFYILDRKHRLLPPGVVGEVYLAGIQVSLGYIGLPDQNKERFLDDSIMPATGQKMYKTGDFGYWDSTSGQICLLGRKDRQIKLRGFRLDLDDLEVRVSKAIPGCETAAIFRREDYLVAAYLAPSINTMEAKALIRQALPPYAMPRTVISVEAFLLTAAGKLDYKGLENLVVDTKSTPQPQNTAADVPNMVIDKWDQPQKRMMATEEMLINIIRDLLNLDYEIDIDQDSDFMMLGGHSILQLQLANRITSYFERRFNIRMIIENPTISGLAAAINAEIGANMSAEQPPISEVLATLGENGVSLIEADWFWKYRKNFGTSSFNVSHVSELNGSLVQQSALICAWNTVLARHSILRCRFRESSGELKRIYAAEAPTACYVKSFDIKEAINREFNLEEESPIRILVSDSHMLVCISHIICDYTTLNRLFEEFAAEYHDTGISTNERRYQDTYFDVEPATATANFWTTYLSGMDLLNQPYMKRSRTSYAGESILFRLSGNVTANLPRISRSKGLTLHQIALGIVSIALQAGTVSKQDLLLGGPYLGRQEADMHTVGLFLQPLPIRISRANEDSVSITAFLKMVQKSAQSALAHGIDWSSLLNILVDSDNEDQRKAAVATIPNHPLFNAMVTFHELGQAQVSKIPGVEPLVSWAKGSKFGIMFEFTAVSPSTTTLRIEYDSNLFSTEEVRRLAAQLDSALGIMSDNVTVAEVEQAMLMSGDCMIEEVEFGTALKKLSERQNVTKLDGLAP